MMGGGWRSPVSVAACAAMAVAGALAIAMPAAGSANGHAAAARGERPVRGWNLTLSPEPNDLALAEFSFGRNHRNRGVTAAMLRLAAKAPFGEDYLAAATPHFATPGELRVLVVLVNRPSPLLDPVAVHVRLSSPRVLGTPLVWKLTDPFSQPVRGLTPALCDLPVHGARLTGSQLRPLRSQGSGLSGFDAASTVAQAYDAACGLPVEQAFERDVRGPQASSPTPPPTPTPTPPPPGCTPCDPAPGYACPLAQPSICVAPMADLARRVSAGSH
jgi:hypothetical protein